MLERRRIVISGIVQGVGFRPFVYGLAARLELGGWVRNHNGSVHIEVEGRPGELDGFVAELRERPPPLARIESIEACAMSVRGEAGFEICDSESDASPHPRICADIAACDDCIAELFDPTNRRWKYPFINCTNCGPRLTIVLGSPYDRQRTTMASFEMCADCRREYENPSDRRFHAQPIACAVCGPFLKLLDGSGQHLDTEDPVCATAKFLRQGRILAIKGLGGFHLACSAVDAEAVRELRRRKRRDEKPFAVMVRDWLAAEQICHIDASERELLESRARPIVLLCKRKKCNLVEEVAPGNPFIGVMLPYTPVHHLLFRELGEMPLVMTSGNRSDEPIAYENDDALKRLGGIADFFLTHNRAIHVRCDDSVTRIINKRESPIRRSRGYAPQPIVLPFECDQPVLAVGGQLKSTFALGRGRSAIISHHLGDLDHFETYRAFERDVELYQQLFAHQPKTIVHDLHPDYASTRYALQLHEKEGVRCVAVQHHHAHMASCMAEHGLNEPVIGVCFDGTGYGSDGAIWGGEFLVGDYAGFERMAHLRYVPMPGGDQVIHEPWRMALAHLRDADADAGSLEKRIDRKLIRTVDLMLKGGFNSPRTSSAGRLFDAVACLAGIRDVVNFEAQAAMQLEWLASESEESGSYPWGADEGIGIDTRPLIRAVATDVAKGMPAAMIARRFHSTMADLVCTTCERARNQTRLNTVVLSGGVFLNSLLTGEVINRLSSNRFRAFHHQLVPTNDGGLSLGQLIIGFCLLSK